MNYKDLNKYDVSSLRTGITGSAIVPVEVKSGSAGRLQSLRLFLLEHSNTPLGLVLSSANVQNLAEQKLRFLPLYTRLGNRDA